ncbi:hypothetical protein TNCV_5007511 [Trichonephila clavipes]|nr:hypothetical protein TNCV_5007511 [Trichonephila clavipes]
METPAERRKSACRRNHHFPPRPAEVMTQRLGRFFLFTRGIDKIKACFMTAPTPRGMEAILNADEKFTCRNCGGGDRGRVAIYRPFGEFHRGKIALSPVWCSRPTTGVPLAHATRNFVGLDLTTSDRWHQKTTTTTYLMRLTSHKIFVV